MCRLRGGRRDYDNNNLLPHDTSKTTINLRRTLRGGGCAEEQEAEELAEGRPRRDRWRSCQWTKAKALENKRGRVTRDNTTTNQTKWHNKWQMGDKR